MAGIHQSEPDPEALGDDGSHRVAWWRASQAQEEIRQLEGQNRVYAKGLEQLAPGHPYQTVYRGIIVANEKAIVERAQEIRRLETESCLQVWPAFGQWTLPHETEGREAAATRRRHPGQAVRELERKEAGSESRG